MSTTTEQEVTGVIDISQLASNTEVVNVDPTANPFARSKPIKDERYRGVLQPPTNAEDKKNMLREFTVKNGDNAGKKFYVINFEAAVQEYYDPKLNSKELLGKHKTFEKRVSSLSKTVDGKETNEVAFLLTKLGCRIEGQVPVAELVKAFMELIERKPQIGLVTKVSARYDSGEKDKSAAGKEFAVWKTAYSGENQFPKNPDGSINYDLPPIVDTRGTHQLYISADVIDYFALSV